MTKRAPPPSRIAVQLRRSLRDGGSAEHAAGWFFKEEIKSHGWYTAALRREAVRQRRSMLQASGLNFLVRVADQLFSGRVLEEKVFAVLLLEKLTENFGDAGSICSSPGSTVSAAEPTATLWRTI
jgi:hypothetical protein